MDIDKRKQREAEFTQQHTLSKEDYRKMILAKIERAKVYSQTVIKREAPKEVR